MQTDKAKVVGAKFKNLRRVLKTWKNQLPNLAKTIQNCKDVVLLLNTLEESRDITLEEWNFRATVIDQLKSLLSQQRIYWKQRGTIKWVKFRDECTEFFHANASIKNNKNTITMLGGDLGRELFEHEAKAQLISLAFKERLGILEFSGINIDLASLLHPAQNLERLQGEFTREEINKVIMDLPNQKSLGPDGFNGDFLKKCWPIIAQDFYDLCDGFFKGTFYLKSINASYVTLVPKKDCPLFIGYFRPISLLNSFIKLLNKLLAERLWKIILTLVHANQYGFIRSRTIHNCLVWAFEYIHLCKSTKEVVILKLDFEKTFDKIEYQAILEILQNKGFGPGWLGGIKDILGSGTSSVLLNGVPGKVFHCKRGIWQGDPLSPLLFVLAADLLQSMVNQAKSQGLINLPIPERVGSDFPIVQYVDDTLLIMEACPRQLLVLKDLLISFAAATGLKVNYNKLVMVPINISEERLSSLSNTFNCQKGSLPFTYLGLPLGTTKPRIEYFLPLVQRIERRLTCTSAFLTQGGKLQIVNSVLSSSVVFYYCSLKLHKGVIKQLDKYRKHCLWKGSDLNAKQPPKAAWPMVCLPKKGGLGVINLSAQNDSLLMKFLHKFYSKADIPWVHLVRDNYYSDCHLHGQQNKGSFCGET